MKKLLLVLMIVLSANSANANDYEKPEINLILNGNSVIARVSDNVEVSSVEIYVDSTLVSTTSVSATNALINIDLDTTKISTGIHFLIGIVYDSSNNASEYVTSLIIGELHDF